MSGDVRRWLEQLGLGQYAAALADNDIDWELLPELDHQTLIHVGISSAGHRLRMIKAAKAIEDGGLAPLGPTNETSKPRSEAERRQLTVMFCDLVDSTELSQQLDPEDLREVNRAYQDACKVAVERYDGYVARYMGDGVLVYFGYPQAHEDDAERAIHAALRVVESVSSLTKQDIEPGVRVGIATGSVVVGDLIGESASQERAVVGETPNLAARLQGLAARNSVVIGPGTYDLIGESFDCVDLGANPLKGIAEPVQAWKVIAPAVTESRFAAARRAELTPLVGREHEVGLLLDRWEQAKEGDGQVVLLAGEPGIGKSRITKALHEHAVADSPTRLRYQCSHYFTNSVLHPVIEQLGRLANLHQQDNDVQKLAKLESLVEGPSGEMDSSVALLGALLSIPTCDRYPSLNMTPEKQKEATLEALVGQIEALSRHNPVLAIFEDAHWSDPTSIEMLELTVARVRALPVMVVITHRPEFTAPWGDYAHVTSLTGL